MASTEITQQQWEEIIRIGDEVAKVRQKEIDAEMERLCGTEASVESEISRLSGLSPLEYETERVNVAKKFNVRASVLDNEVKKLYQSEESETEVVTSDEPFFGKVNGEHLLSTIEQIIARYIILPQGALPAIALWIACTYVYDSFRVFPKLAVISPEKRCGKTTLLDILSGLCYRSLIASNISPSAIFRSVDLWKPTLIIDEADTFLTGRNDNIIGIINSGHTRNTAFVIRVTGEDHIPKRFSTWSPMAFASIGGLIGTDMDRSVVVSLRRKVAGETVNRLPIDFKDDNASVRQKLVKWGQDNFHTLKTNTIEPPEIQNDRAMDNWLPLFTVAGAIGGNWPDKVKTAYTLLNSFETEETAAVMLLQDIQSIFETKNWVKVFSCDLVNELIKLEERPWGEWKKGKPMTQNSLSKILSTFSIHSKQLRIGSDKKRGFESEQFHDAFVRYIPIQSGTPVQTSHNKGLNDIQSGTNSNNVPFHKQLKPKHSNICTTVPLQQNQSNHQEV